VLADKKTEFWGALEEIPPGRFRKPILAEGFSVDIPSPEYVAHVNAEFQQLKYGFGACC